MIKCVRNYGIWKSSGIRLLAVNIDSCFTIDLHVLTICSKANKKLTILSRLFKFLNFEKRRVIVKA